MTEPVHYRLDGFPPNNIDWARLVPLIGQANAALARYDGLVAAVPNAKVLLSPLITQEAVLSSKIEGTNVTMSEVLEIEAGAGDNGDQPKRDDAEEILNYRQALSSAARALDEDRPLSQHLLREAHALLMQGVRGRDKDPGSFRNEQNRIGPRGCAIDEASFVPILQEQLQAGLDCWSAYVQNHDERDPLVQLAVIHVEFEALHPFKDGNGRLGRMLIPLFLYERGVLSGPNFYMSGYLEARREQYVESMRAVSRDGAWTDWCVFFLEGMIRQALENQARTQQIIDLNTWMQREVAEITHSQFSGLAVDFLFSNPIFSTPHFVSHSRIPKNTAFRILRALRRREEPVLRTIHKGAGRKPAIHAFTELVNVAEGRQVF